MNPRLATSKKWTPFPNEYLDQIKEVFKENFTNELANSKIIAEGRIYAYEITLRIGVLESGSLKQNNFEVSLQYDPEAQDALNKISTCIDAVASMLNEYFETEGDIEFPYSWQEYEFGSEKVYLQYSTVNSELEEEANKLLGIEKPGLFNEEIDPENEEDVDLSTPSLFKSKSKKNLH